MLNEQFCASEDSVVMYCDPCQFEGIKKDASEFCHECNEFLCKQCLHSHCKFQAFRNHHILHGDNMPRTKQETGHKLALKFCDDHQLNEVQFFCSKHESVFCSICKMAKHINCDCTPIEDICEEDDEAKFNAAVKEIKDIKKEFVQLKSIQIEHIDNATVDLRSQQAELNSVRLEINKYLDKLENEIKSEEKEQVSYVQELRKKAAMYTDVINHIASLEEHTDHVVKSQDKVATFAGLSKLRKINGEYTALKKTVPLTQKTEKPRDVKQKLMMVKEMWDKIENKINLETSEEVKEENEDVELSASKSTDAEILRENKCSLNETGDEKEENRDNSTDASINYKIHEGNFNLTNRKDEPGQKEKLVHLPVKDIEVGQKPGALIPEKKFDNLTIKQVYYKPLDFGTSGSACDITGSLFLPDGSLILCDHANSNLILLDREFQLLHKLHFEGNLWDVALVSTNEIITTLTNQKTLKYIQIESGRLHEGARIDLKRVPWGIAVYKDNLLTTFHNNPGKGVIEIRHKHGKILRSVTVDENGEDLLNSPYYVTVNQHNGDIYVTDSRKNSLTCLTFDGKPLFRIVSEELKWPRKVILDDQSNCLLCASLTNKLILINNKEKQPGIKDSRVWLKQCKRPQTVAIRWEDQTMGVGLNTNNNMLVLKLKK